MKKMPWSDLASTARALRSAGLSEAARAEIACLAEKHARRRGDNRVVWIDFELGFLEYQERHGVDPAQM